MLLRGNRRLRRLAALAAPPPLCWPRVSVIFAARNEGHTVGAAVATMLALDYPDWELVAVNDRSDDPTGAVLDALAAREPRLRVDHIGALPAGWLGKTHALHHGAAQATGAYILFTDADVHFRPDVLRRAVAHAEAAGLDLLSAVPELHGSGHALGVCVNAFGLAFTAGLRPWLIPNPRSSAHGSVGAFGLVRTATYRRLGGHAPLRLRPDDDIKLGRWFKLHGARCEMLLGRDALTVAWYHGVGAMIRGLEKNSYAAADYRPWLIGLGAAACLLFFLWPVAALVLTSGPAWFLHAGAVVLMLALGCDQTRFSGGRWWYGLLLPAGAAVFAAAVVRSMLVTLRRGGIVWRGTFYPLGELRANRL
jgi:glycosyltransferase involved in cell wall biosynthesis